MKVYFGLELDDRVLPLPAASTLGVSYFGPQGLLHFLSTLFGIPKPPLGAEYLRLEQYRQSLRAHLAASGEGELFYRRSFQSDQFATAAEILGRRDELLLAGWDFTILPGAPGRLQTIAEVEVLFRKLMQERYFAGFADRWTEVLKGAETRTNPIRELWVCDPQDSLPPHLVSLIVILEKNGTHVEYLTRPIFNTDSDLRIIQRALQSPEATEGKAELKGDGSLLILRGPNEATIASYLAKVVQLNPEFRPNCLIPGDCRALDNALVQEGLPSLGIRSASLARPSMQVLKLATSFLWKPVDPYKLLEFVSLQIKPLDHELAARMAEYIVQKPGIKGEGWYALIHQYFQEIDEDPRIDLATAKEMKFQYRFWFERHQYDLQQAAPKEEVYAIFEYLEGWALQYYQGEGEKDEALLKLSLQARKAKELLEVLPETSLQAIEIERIVKTIYEPAAIQFTPSQQGYLAYTNQPGAIIGPVENLIWWNFTDQEAEYFFSKWYRTELKYLSKADVPVVSPEQQNELLNYRKKQPVLACARRLILCIPDKIKGSPALPHPLLGNFAARFSNLEDITVQINPDTTSPGLLSEFFRLPDLRLLNLRQLARPKPFIEFKIDAEIIQDAEHTESPTSLESLLYYPYQWFFRSFLKIKKSSILSISDQQTLLGNLAHRLIDKLLTHSKQDWSKEDLEVWIETEADSLLQREGAVLLMYGKEAERINFINTIKFSAWRLVNIIRENQWEVEQTEQALEGRCADIQLRGRADLILRRRDEQSIIDLKWSGSGYRSQLIKNEEDLQLVLYANLLDGGQTWPHSAYYILRNGKMIARNRLAFSEVVPVSEAVEHVEVNERIIERIGNTYRWRRQQIGRGRIEVRCEHTEQDLEDHYQPYPMGLLEMKKGDATFDDYRVLINLVE